jgi:hypothetical protein
MNYFIIINVAKAFFQNNPTELTYLKLSPFAYFISRIQCLYCTKIHYDVPTADTVKQPYLILSTSTKQGREGGMI